MFTKSEKSELLDALYQKVGNLENTLFDTKEKLEKCPFLTFLNSNIDNMNYQIEFNKKLAEKIKLMETIDDLNEKLNKVEAELNEEDF